MCLQLRGIVEIVLNFFKEFLGGGIVLVLVEFNGMVVVHQFIRVDLGSLAMQGTCGQKHKGKQIALDLHVGQIIVKNSNNDN